MKKTLVALAALAATGAFAQSSVQIDGNFEGGLQKLQYGNTNYTVFSNNLSTTSQINFRGTNDLGGGMTAFWHVENDLNLMNQNDANGVAPSVSGGTNGNTSNFANGDLSLGVNSAAGKFTFGTINNFNLISHLTAQPFGTAFGSAFRITGGSLFTAAVRDNNTFQYVTPAIAGGLTLGWMGRPQQATSGAGGTAVTAAAVNSPVNAGTSAANGQSRVSSLAAMYNAGPVNVQFTSSVDDARNVTYANGQLNAVLDSVLSGVNSTNAISTAGSVGKYTALVGNYTMGAATLYAGYQSNQLSANATALSNVKINAFNVAGKYVMGANSFMGNYATEGTNGQNTKTVGLGYEYALSKTTAVTARYEKISDGLGLAYSSNDTVGVIGSTLNTNRTRMGVGVRVGF